MNRGRLRRYALRVLAAALLGAGLLAATGIAHAETVGGSDGTTSVGKVVNPPPPAGVSAPAESIWQ